MDIGLAVNTGKINSMEVGRRRGMMANWHIAVGRRRWEDNIRMELLESPCECGAEPPDFISHGAS